MSNFAAQKVVDLFV